MDSLSVRSTPNSTVYPTIRVDSRPGKLLMGVFDEAGDYIADTALDRRSGEKGAPVPTALYPEPVQADVPAAIYAGPLYFHFGHFLLESLARVWYAQQQPDLPLVWAGSHVWQGYQLAPWQQEILDILQVGNPSRIIAEPTRFELLHIPDIGYRYDDRFHPEHAEFLGRYEGPPQLPGRRLWLSRSKIGTEVRDLSAAPTERLLVDAGWVLAHPETLSVREQLDQLSQAEIVAGEEGSAFHALMLLTDLSAKKIKILRRYGPEHGNNRTVGDARSLDQEFYTLQRELVIKAEGRVVSKVNPTPSEILDVLGVPVRPAAETEPPGPGEAILHRAVADLDPESLLDVGSSEPHLVLESSATTRVAVSPRFGFDSRTYADSMVDFYALGLEQYVELFHGDRGAFDLIRVTGPELRDVMASFEVSKRVAHDNTTWILGSGNLAAKAALAIRLTHPGFSAKRLFVPRRAVYVAQRVPGEPTDVTGVGRLSMAEVHRRIRSLPPAGVVGLRAWVDDGLDSTLGKSRADQLRRVELKTRRRLGRPTRAKTPDRSD